MAARKDRFSVGLDGVYKDGFANVPMAILTSKNLSPTEKLLYSYLCGKAFSTENIQIDIKTIAADLSMSDRHVWTLTENLTDKGYIFKYRGGNSEPNRYVLCIFPENEFPVEYAKLYGDYERPGKTVRAGRKTSKYPVKAEAVIDADSDLVGTPLPTSNSDQVGTPLPTQVGTGLPTQVGTGVPTSSLYDKHYFNTHYNSADLEACVCLASADFERETSEAEAFVLQVVERHTVSDTRELRKAIEIAAYSQTAGKVNSGELLLLSKKAFNERGDCTLVRLPGMEKKKAADRKKKEIAVILGKSGPISRAEYDFLNAGLRSRFVEIGESGTFCKVELIGEYQVSGDLGGYDEAMAAFEEALSQ